ncbi:MAG: hypothetical protein RL685_4208, partial [Pseudomonadota bacterium]
MMVLRECRVSALILLAAALSSACSEEDAPPEEAVGSATPQSSAGTTGAGGAAGNSGSSAGSGGAAGSSASNGSAGGGTVGTVSPAASPTETIAFAAGLDGFRINYYCSGNPPACVQVMDAAAEAADAGLAAPEAANDFVEAVFDPTVGEPAPGSARVTLQFSADGQLADFARNFGTD